MNLCLSLPLFSQHLPNKPFLSKQRVLISFFIFFLLSPFSPSLSRPPSLNVSFKSNPADTGCCQLWVEMEWSGLGGHSLLVLIHLTTVSGFTEHLQCILRTILGARTWERRAEAWKQRRTEEAVICSADMVKKGVLREMMSGQGFEG